MSLGITANKEKNGALLAYLAKNILKSFINPQIVGVLSDKKYIDLICSFLHSLFTPKKYIPIFDKILHKYLD